MQVAGATGLFILIGVVVIGVLLFVIFGSNEENE